MGSSFVSSSSSSIETAVGSSESIIAGFGSMLASSKSASKPSIFAGACVSNWLDCPEFISLDVLTGLGSRLAASKSKSLVVPDFGGWSKPKGSLSNAQSPLPLPKSSLELVLPLSPGPNGPPEKTLLSALSNVSHSSISLLFCRIMCLY